MSNLNIEMMTQPPTFYQFMYHRYKALGFERSLKSDTMCDYGKGKESGRVDFRVELTEERKTIVSVPVSTPPKNIPDWLESLFDEYEKVLAEWNAPGGNLTVKYIYQ